MNIGDIVIFNGKKFIIRWIYESGYCELKHIENTTIELVHISCIRQLKNVVYGSMFYEYIKA